MHGKLDDSAASSQKWTVIQERLWVWRKEILWNVLVHSNRHWNIDPVYETGPEWSRKLINLICIVSLLNTHSLQLNSYSCSIIPQLNSTWSHIHVCRQPLLMEPFCKTTVITCHCRDHCGYMTSNNKEDSYQIVLFLFINAACLLCQKLYCLYNTQLPTIANYYHSRSLRPAPQCLAFSSL